MVVSVFLFCLFSHEFFFLVAKLTIMYRLPHHLAMGVTKFVTSLYNIVHPLRFIHHSLLNFRIMFTPLSFSRVDTPFPGTASHSLDLLASAFLIRYFGDISSNSPFSPSHTSSFFYVSFLWSADRYIFLTNS